MFILPFFSVESYSIIKNTTSHLGAQNAPNAWIMNLTFLSLGIFSIVGGWSFFKGFLFHKIVLVLFGLSLILAGYFQHKPIVDGIEFSESEDNLHSLFSTITGFSFTLLAISTAFILNLKTDKILALSIAIFATGLSILMFSFPEQMGIWQRLIFMSCFGWMIYTFRNPNKLNKA